MVANDFMFLFRGIIFFLLLTVGLFLAAAGGEAIASTPMPVMPYSVGNHDAVKLTAPDHCKSVRVSAEQGSNHHGCCRDMNCGSCAQTSMFSLTSFNAPVLPPGESANAMAIALMVGRNIAPETGPPKSFA